MPVPIVWTRRDRKLLRRRARPTRCILGAAVWANSQSVRPSLATDEGFVHLDFAAEHPGVITHQFPDLAEHPPSCLVSDAKLTF